MKMTSVDSGVETGNDSNDSLVTQLENIPECHTSDSDSKDSEFWLTPAERRKIENNKFSIAVSAPLIDPSHFMENKIFSTNSNFQNSEAGASGPLALCSNPIQIMEFRIPTFMPRGSLFSYSSLSSMKAEVKSWTTFKPKMKSFKVRRVRRHLMLEDVHRPHRICSMCIAATTNNIELMRRLLESGESPNSKHEYGRSLLHLASCRGYTEMVKLLLSYGADPNQRDCIGNTPLHLAAVTSNISVVTLLLEAGTDVLSLDQDGQNPLQIAETKLRRLQSYGGTDLAKMKEEVQNIIIMLSVYFHKQKTSQEQIESLSSFCSRLSLSNTSDQIQDDVRNLLANVESLNLRS